MATPLALCSTGLLIGLFLPAAALAQAPAPAIGAAPAQDDRPAADPAAPQRQGQGAPAPAGAPGAAPTQGGAAPPPPPPPPPPGGEAAAPRRAWQWTTGIVEVVGRAPRALELIPGTAQVVRREDLRQLAAQSSADALRTVPGVNVVSEDGMGLRLNVGVRGLDPNRSRKILVLEDGLPVSLNPYGAPELYYSPAIERMERVEVVKGSGQILWGPQTIGGVLNFLTRDPPKRFAANADLRYGSYGYLLAQAGVGATHGPIGWRVDVIHRRFDGPRRLDLGLSDVSGKLRLQLAARSTLTLKLAFYDEGSRATYLGLTAPQLAQDPTLNLASNDEFHLRRYALSLNHQHLFTPRLLLQTGLYAYQTARVWRRQEYDRLDLGVDYERICDRLGRCGRRGDGGITPDNAGGSVFFRPSAALRDRRYGVAGVEPRLVWTWSTPRPVSGELSAVVRLHYEHARERVLLTSYPTAWSGDIRDDEERGGYALAAAVQNRFVLWDRLFITPGLRVESFFSDRRVLRERQVISGVEVGRDVDRSGQARSVAVIPGLGVSAQVAAPLLVFGGVHRGYAPPRSKDAVSGAGQNLQLDPELSWNVELGARVSRGRWLSGELAGFYLDFENQIIPPAESSGAVAQGMFNAGRSRHAGLELSGTFDPAGALGARRFALPLNVNYTYLPLAAFVGGLYDGVRLPYAPEHLLYAQLRFAHQIGVSAQVGVTYVSAQAADRGVAFDIPPETGLVGEIPGYALLDARLAYTFPRVGLTAYVAGKNLTDQRVITSRAPAGIQPGGFLQIFGGVEWNLNLERSAAPGFRAGGAGG